ncbi:hypothetical protein OKW39_003692 [Paraburkholderia sp. MM6662-R1]
MKTAPYSENSGPVEHRRNPRRQRTEPPAELDEFAEQIGGAERQQQFGQMPVPAPAHAPQQPAFERRAEQPDEERRNHQRAPEAGARRHRKADVRAEHIEARMREVEHAEHAEDQRQPGRQHE